MCRKKSDQPKQSRLMRFWSQQTQSRGTSIDLDQFREREERTSHSFSSSSTLQVFPSCDRPSSVVSVAESGSRVRGTEEQEECAIEAVVEQWLESRR